MSDERREHKRFTCYLIARNEKNRDEIDFFGVVRNISQGGAMLETENDIEPDWLLNLTFLSSDNVQVWEGTGRVVWVRSKQNQNIVGIQFNRPLDQGWLVDQPFLEPDRD